MTAVPTQPIKSFSSPAVFERWLAKNYQLSNGIWIKFAKKASGVKSVYYADALDVALCYGWIDGQSKVFDETYYLQRFTPRRARSMWSKRNIEHVTRLTAEGRMTPAGQTEIDRAKADGRWEAAYDSPKNMTVPDDFMTAVKKHKKAYAFFQTLNKTNTYAISWRLQTAKKTETRAKRFEAMLDMLKNGEKFHS